VSGWKFIKGRRGYTEENPCRFPECVRQAIGMDHWELIWVGGIVGVCVPHLVQPRAGGVWAKALNEWTGFALVKGEWEWAVTDANARAVFAAIDIRLGLRPTVWERITL